MPSEHEAGRGSIAHPWNACDKVLSITTICLCMFFVRFVMTPTWLKDLQCWV